MRFRHMGDVRMAGNHHIRAAANQKQMFVFVAANKQQTPPWVDRHGIQNLDPVIMALTPGLDSGMAGKTAKQPCAQRNEREHDDERNDKACRKGVGHFNCSPFRLGLSAARNRIECKRFQAIFAQYIAKKALTPNAQSLAVLKRLQRLPSLPRTSN